MSKHIISATEYDTWVYNWKRQEHTTSPYTFFLHKEKMQTGMAFEFDHLRYLLSTTGVTTVKIRFGLHEFTDGQDPKFHLVLFGADGGNEVITPYFTSPAFTHHHNDYPVQGDSEGNLPQALMKEWEKDWQDQVTAGTVGQQNFKIRYGFLQGYNYPLKEFMEALGTFKGASTIHIKFGLHKYYDRYETPESVLIHVHTFGLVLYACTKAPDGDATKAVVIDESGYYDLTAPCPQTC